eukprot:gene10104-2524_t
MYTTKQTNIFGTTLTTLTESLSTESFIPNFEEYKLAIEKFHKDSLSNILQTQETSIEDLIKIFSEENFISSLSKQKVVDLAKLCDNVYEEKEIDIGKIALEQVTKLKEAILTTRKNDESGNLIKQFTNFFSEQDKKQTLSMENLTHDLNVLEHEISILKNISVRNMIELLKDNETFGSYRVLGYSLRNDNQLSSIFIYNQPTNHMVIIFKGTKTVQDWSTNLDFGVKNSSSIFGKTSFKLHGGFQSTFLDRIQDFDESFDQILSLYKEELQKSKLMVTVTGHSLGGALSTIASCYIKKKHQNIISTVNNISFASPKVFTDTSTEIVESILGKTNILRIWNQLDPIPLLPKSGQENDKSIIYKHVGYDIMYKESEFVNTHGMTRYIHLSQEQYPNLKSLKEELEQIQDLKVDSTKFIRK